MALDFSRDDLCITVSYNFCSCCSTMLLIICDLVINKYDYHSIDQLIQFRSRGHACMSKQQAKQKTQIFDMFLQKYSSFPPFYSTTCRTN